MCGHVTRTHSFIHRIYKFCKFSSRSVFNLNNNKRQFNFFSKRSFFRNNKVSKICISYINQSSQRGEVRAEILRSQGSLLIQKHFDGNSQQLHSQTARGIGKTSYDGGLQIATWLHGALQLLCLLNERLFHILSPDKTVQCPVRWFYRSPVQSQRPSEGV